MKYNIYLVLVGISTCVSFSVSFQWHFHLSIMFSGTPVPVGWQSGLDARPLEFVSFLTLYININQNKTLIPLPYLTTVEYRCTLCEQNHSFSLELRVFSGEPFNLHHVLGGIDMTQEH